MSSCEPDARPDSIGTAGAAARPAINTRPWEPDQAVAAGLAVQAISKLLGKHIARNNAISPDTLFVTVGALTGFAAQYALLQDLKGRGLTPPCDDMLVVLARNGARYFASDKLNAMLVPERPESISAFSLIGGAAMSHGTTAGELPDCLEIFRHAIDSFGTADFGQPRLPEGQRSWLQPRKAVEIFWPSVLTAFTREPIVPIPDFKLVEPRHWPLLLANVGVYFIGLLKPSGVAPARAVRAFMEAAIPMSKIDPATLNFSGKAS